MHYRILTASRSRGIAQGLTYEAGKKLKVGSAVRVPLRKRFVEGIVIEGLKKRKEQFKLKQVQELLSHQPLLFEHQLKLLRWMAEEYFCSLRQAVSVFVPGREWGKLVPTEVSGFMFQVSGFNVDAVRGEKQHAVLEYLQGKEWVSEAELKESTGASSATIGSLLSKGLIEKESRPSSLDFARDDTLKINRPKLTKLQNAAYQEIRNSTKPSLLFGVTGSGKTEIYMELIADAIEAGKQSILLVPEILLTEHCIHRFEKLLNPNRIAVIHSRLTSAKRRETWKRIRYGNMDLVIGSRSALFTPVQRLGLVIIDEEHEWTYKNEHAPRYSARDAAEALCRFAKAKLVLGTATPSLESWARAAGDVSRISYFVSGMTSGRIRNTKYEIPNTKLYHLVKLPTRYGNQSLPNVRIIDLATVQFGSLYPFSPPLLEAIERQLKRKEQSVLFLNRRGIATGLLCLDCRRRVVSPDSQLPFTVHRKSDGHVVLVDHTTNLTIDPPMFCAHCGSGALQEVGAGTQRIEGILRRQFPKARLLRADSDTLTHPDDMRELLAAMREGRADILLGTQSVVKGLDLPNVTLAAVLLADIGLSLPHFRAGERIFQLLTQLTGRSGRAKSGEVIIQTFRPDAPEIKLAAEHKTEEYLNQEWKLRLHTGYPPASRMIRFLLRGPNAFARAQSLCTDIAKMNKEQALDLSVNSAPTLFGGGTIWHVLIRGANPRAVLENLNLEDVIVDVDPVECV